jgi:hypothetical protein
MRIIAGLKCGRASISLGTKDDSKIASCCIQLDMADDKWLKLLKYHIEEYKSTYQNAINRYGEMADAYKKKYEFPHDLFDIWQIIEQG